MDVLCSDDGVLRIVELVPGFKHKSLLLDDELHLPRFASKQGIPMMRVLTLVSFGPITVPALDLAFEITLSVAKRRPSLSYLDDVQRKSKLALDEIWFSAVLTAGDEGWDFENEYKDRQEADGPFHRIINPLKVLASNPTKASWYQAYNPECHVAVIRYALSRVANVPYGPIPDIPPPSTTRPLLRSARSIPHGRNPSHSE